MTNKSIVLGSVCLDQYVSEPTNHQNELESINREIQGLDDFEKMSGGKRYGIENIPFNDLQRRRELLANKGEQLKISSQYKELDLSFLGMGQLKEYQGDTIQLPRFSVYSLGSPTFSIHFQRMTNNLDIIPKLKNMSGRGDIEIVIYAPKIFSDQLIKSLEFNKYSNPQVGSFQNIPRKILEKYAGLGYVSVWGTEFNGILPEKTRERIKEASKDMKEHDIYVITESKPEDWRRISMSPLHTCDPLVVGFHGDKCYLIDHFNTTNLEDYVRREFTS